MSEVAFINCPPWGVEMPSLSLAYPAEYVRSRGYDCSLLDLNLDLYAGAGRRLQRAWDTAHSSFWWRADMISSWLPDETAALARRKLAALIQKNPTAVGLSTHSLNVMVVAETVRLLRHGGYQGLVFVGGPGVMLPDPEDGAMRLFGFPSDDLSPAEASRRLSQLVADVDAFIYREGEVTLLDLLERHRAGGRGALPGTPGAIVPQDGAIPPTRLRRQVQDLDSLPWPTFREADVPRYASEMLPVLLSRGCPRRCSMCFQGVIWPGYRHRKVQGIVEELTHHIVEHGVRQFHTYDQSTNGSMRFIEALCDAIISRGLDLALTGNIIVHPRMDRRLMEKMARAGFVDVIIGVESGSPEMLKRMGKGFTVEQAEQLLGAASAAGVRANINMMTGFPGETEQDHLQTTEFLQRNQRHISMVTLAGPTMIYPDTELARRPEDFGIIPQSISRFGALSACEEWRDVTGLDQATRMERCVHLSRLLHELGIPMEDDPQGDSIEAVATDLADVCRILLEGETFEREQVAASLDSVLDPALVPTLLQAADDPCQGIRWNVRMALARLEPARVCSRALDGLASDNAAQRRLAAMTLALAGGDEAFEHLEPELSREKYEALDQGVRRALRPLRQVSALLERLEASGPEAMEPEELEQLMGAEACHWGRLRTLSIAASNPAWLAALKEAYDLDDIIQQALQAMSPRTRLRARATLARFEPERAVRVAIADLTSPHELTRYQAAVALAWLGGDRAFEHLESRLKQEQFDASDTWFQRQLWPLRRVYARIEALERGGPDAVEPGELDRLLGEEACPWIRLRTVAAVAHDEEWLSQLVRRLDLTGLLRQALEHPVPAVVHAALKALVAMGPARSQPWLASFLEDEAYAALPPAWQETLRPARCAGEVTAPGDGDEQPPPNGPTTP